MNVVKYFVSFIIINIFLFYPFINTTLADELKDGRYTGTAKGFEDEISVEVEIISGKIKNIRILNQNESQPKTALEAIPKQIVEKQSTDGIEAVSGATYTSDGIMNAVTNALAKAAGKINTGTLPSAQTENNADLPDQLKLPSPKLDKNKSLADALQNRISIRDFDSSKELSLQMISNLLWAASGVNRANGRMTAPTAFDWREIEIFIAIRQGAFKYDPRKNMLVKVISGDIRSECGLQEFVKDAAVTLIYVANYWKMTGQGGPEMLKFYAAVDTGYISQNVYLYCASEGLATVALGGVDKPALEKRLNLRSQNQSVILTQPVGYPKN